MDFCEHKMVPGACFHRAPRRRRGEGGESACKRKKKRGALRLPPLQVAELVFLKDSSDVGFPGEKVFVGVTNNISS